MTPKVLAKEPRGFYDFQHDQAAKSIVVGWNDNRPVYMVSSVYGVNPVGVCTRWSVSENFCSVTTCCCTVQQIYGRGGQNGWEHRKLSHRDKVQKMVMASLCFQCWNKHSQRLVDLSENWPAQRTAAWLSGIPTYSCQSVPDEVHRPAKDSRSRSSKSSDKRVPDAVWYDGLNHWCVPAMKQNRCAHCHKNTTKMCKKCTNINLHDRLCFKVFHTHWLKFANYMKSHSSVSKLFNQEALLWQRDRMTHLSV